MGHSTVCLHFTACSDIERGRDGQQHHHINWVSINDSRHSQRLLRPVWNPFSSRLPPSSLCSISIVLSPLLSVFCLCLPRFPLFKNAFVSFISLPALLFDCHNPVCALFTVPRGLSWLIYLTHSMPDLDFDIDVTTEWFIALCIRELCACVTCWHWIMTAQLIEHLLKWDIWLLDFQITGACRFFCVSASWIMYSAVVQNLLPAHKARGLWF